MAIGARYAVVHLTVFAAVALAACGAEEPTAPGSAPEPEPEDPVVAELVTLVNAYRENIGCEALTWHPLIASVAQAHSQDMVERDYFGHENPDGVSFSARLFNAGLRWEGIAAENLAVEDGGPRAVLDLWLATEFPRTALGLCAFTHHGVGLADGRWTHLLVENPL